ncbi:ervatamin-B-like isoform X2 [Tripterygium wilfordii]|nr:ervatamin-B-like isoform X2 [Tripterygium wilfordii]
MASVSHNVSQDAVDWRKYLTVIRDQGHCWCCWAFASTAAIEGAYNIFCPKVFYEVFGEKIFNPSVMHLSVQQLIDSVVIDPTKNRVQRGTGCFTSSPNNAYRWILENGICFDRHYPYLAERGRPKEITAPVLRINGFSRVGQSEEEILKAVAKQPITAGIKFSSALLKFNGDGVYEGPPPDENQKCFGRHAVLVVGYSTTPEGKRYYLIRNSWGEKWGDHGYAKVSREKINDEYLLSQFSYPDVGDQS